MGLLVFSQSRNIEFINETIQRCCSGDELDEIISICLEKRKTMNSFDTEIMTLDGRTFEIVATQIQNKDESESIMVVIKDISEQKRMEYYLAQQKKNLLYQATHDVLTGLANRQLFQDHLSLAVKNAHRQGSKFALLFVDLDYFKEVNDRYGHDVGDELLKQVSFSLSKLLCENDLLSRLGGDEFTFILSDTGTADKASIVATKILALLKKPFFVYKHELHISASIGIAFYPKDAKTDTELVNVADQAMYQAKKLGKNNFQLASLFCPE